MLLGLPRGMKRVVAVWCEAQLALHALPVADFARALAAAGVAPGDFSFETQLASMHRWTAESGLQGLAPGVAWLVANRPTQVPPAICHGDLHPFNIMVDGNRITGVIDWGGLTIADPALDLGTTLGTTAALPLAVPRPLGPLIRAVLRAMARAFIRAYCRGNPLDAASLRYFQVWCCLRQLLWVGRGAAAGQPRVGAFGSPEGVRNLVAHIRALTGVAVELPVFAGG
jgi:aminoglycoside phosphotransferase (APT) family kinase protein